MNTNSSLVSKVASPSAPTNVLGSAYCSTLTPDVLVEPYTVPTTPAVTLLAGATPKSTSLRSSTCTGIYVQVGTLFGRVWANATMRSGSVPTSDGSWAPVSTSGWLA